MKGRKPKPTHLKRLAGRQASKLNQYEPEPVGDLVDPPEWLDDDQRAEWRYIIDSAPNGLLKKLDQGAVVAFVVATNEYRKAAMTLARVSQGGPLHAIALAIMNRQAQIKLRYAAELGFTPSSRGRVMLASDSATRRGANRLAEFGLD